MNQSGCQNFYMYDNFDGSYQVKPCKIYFPENINQLISIIKNNNNKGKKIRVSAGHHVFNDISGSNDIMIRMDKFNKIISVDREKKTVTAEGGIIVYDLILALLPHKLALHTIPAVSAQSLAGAISTATHGSRADTGSLAAAIISFTIVLPDGSFRQINRQDNLFPAMVVSIGTMGVIYSITLQCEDLYDIEEEVLYMEWPDTILNLDNILANYPLTEIYADIRTKNCKILLRRKKQKNNTSTYMFKSPRDSHMGLASRNDVYYKMLTTSKIVSYIESEIAVPYNFLNSSIIDLFDLLKTDRYPHHVLVPTLLIRFSGMDRDIYLSQSSDYSLVAHISFFSDSKNVDSVDLKNTYEKIENLLCTKYLGRPHLGKKNFLTKAKMIRLYKNYENFLQIRKQIDTYDIFVNDYIKRII